MAGIEVRFRRPRQERRHVARHLVDGRLGAVRIGHLPRRGQRRRHRDVEVGEIRVVMQPLGRLRTRELLDQRRRLRTVAGQQRVDVVGAVMPCLRHQRQVGRQRIVVGGPRGDLVRERRRKIVRRHVLARRGFPGFRIHRRLFDHPLIGNRLNLGLGIADLGQIAERHILQAVAGRADLLEHLKAALQLPVVVFAEEAVRRQPNILGMQVEDVLGRFRRRLLDRGLGGAEERDREHEDEGRADEGCDNARHDGLLSPSRFRRAPRATSAAGPPTSSGWCRPASRAPLP